MSRMFFTVGPFLCIVSSHGYFRVSDSASTAAGEMPISELGHGIRYLRDDLRQYSAEEVDHAANWDSTTGDEIPWLTWLTGGGGDEISPRLGDPLIQQAAQEWVVRHQNWLARSFELIRQPPSADEEFEIMMPDPPPHQPLDIEQVGEQEPDLVLRTTDGPGTARTVRRRDA
jgi:hypothetical protein